MFRLRRHDDLTAATPSKVEKVMGEFKAGKLHSGKGGPRVRSRKQAIAIAMSEQRKTMTADAFTAEQRRKMADSGEALPDGSYPIPDVEFLRKAIGALGRASQHGDYERVKRHIVKRARALDAMGELPGDWDLTAAASIIDSIDNAYAMLMEEFPEGNGYGDLCYSPYARKIYYNVGDWYSGEHIDRAKELFGEIEGIEEVEIADEGPRIPGGWIVLASANAHGGFTVRENGSGRFEVVNADGAKVAETTVIADAQKLCHEKNGGEEMDEPLVAAATGVPLEGIESGLGEWVSLATDDPEMEAIVAAIPVQPPAEWFDLEEPDEPTPITVTDEGMIYGHAAIWGTRHLGNPRGAGVFVKPPMSQTDYALFHLGELEAEDGAMISVGQITLDTGHAPIGGTSARTAAAHYDDTGTVVADVRARNGKLGVWYSGALRPDMTPEKLRKLRAAKISGDWRGGELVGMLCVNVPGFPVPRAAARIVASADGTESVMALVAAGIVGEIRDRSDVEVEIRVLAARAEGGIEGLAALAASGIEDLTAAVKITIDVTDDVVMPEIPAALEQEVAMQVDYFRDHGYWSSDPLSAALLSDADMRLAQDAASAMIGDPTAVAAEALRDRLIARGLLV